jgi:hypothetical protein
MIWTPASIVSATLADAVHLGLIANEARPTALSDPKSGQTLAYVYFEDEPGQRAAAKLLSKLFPRRLCGNFVARP